MIRRAEILFDGIEEDELVRAAAERGVLAALEFEEAEGEISVVLTNDETIHVCNRDFRCVDRATDVLSFPVSEGEELISVPDGYLGDIMISVETAARQAEELGHGAAREITFLAIHGTLHILGYDHMEPDDAEVMYKEQREILKNIEG